MWTYSVLRPKKQGDSFGFHEAVAKVVNGGGWIYRLRNSGEIIVTITPLDGSFATETVKFGIMDGEGLEALDTSMFPKMDKGWSGFVGYVGVIK